MGTNPYRRRCGRCENCQQGKYKWLCLLVGHKVEKIDKCPKTKKEAKSDDKKETGSCDTPEGLAP